MPVRTETTEDRLSPRSPDELELEAKTYLARALQPVVLSRGSARVEAERLSADLKQDRIVLENGHGRMHR